MRLSIDLDTAQLTLTGTPILKAGKKIPVQLRFLRGQVAQDLGEGATGSIAVKAAGGTIKLNADAGSDAWEKQGSGPTTVYDFLIDFDTEPALAAVASGKIQIALAVNWSSDESPGQESSTLLIDLLPRLVTGTEGTPAEIPDLKANDAQAVDPSNNANWMTPRGVGLYLDTHGGEAPYALYNDSNLDSGSFSALAKGKYAVDTTSGPAYAVLPSSPTPGDTIVFADAKGTWNTHALTIQRNGKKIEGLDIDYQDTAQGTQFFLIYIDETTGWKIYESGTKPHILVAPTAPTGTAQVGSILTANNGTWTGSPTSYSHQWQNSPDGETWTDISGATNATYTLQNSDLGLYVSVLVTAANSNGSSIPAQSAATTIVSAIDATIGLIAQYKFDDAVDLGLDSTSNANELTNNGPAVPTAGPAGGGDLAFLGDGGSYLSRGIQLIPSGDWSIRFQLQNNGGGVICGSCSTGPNGVLFHSYAGAMNVQMQQDDTTLILNTTVPLPASGEWGEYLFTYNATTGEINGYKDGVNVLSTTFSGAIGTVSNDFWVGRRWDDYSGFDAIDSLCIWNRELSSTEATAILGVDI